jgi:hypothetical protein
MFPQAIKTVIHLYQTAIEVLIKSLGMQRKQTFKGALLIGSRRRRRQKNLRDART